MAAQSALLMKTKPLKRGQNAECELLLKGVSSYLTFFTRFPICRFMFFNVFYLPFRSAFSDSVPSLFQLCIHVLQEHVDDIAECGGLPFDILEPVLERAKPDALMTIEDYNPYLMEDTGKLILNIWRVIIHGYSSMEIVYLMEDTGKSILNMRVFIHGHSSMKIVYAAKTGTHLRSNQATSLNM